MEGFTFLVLLRYSLSIALLVTLIVISVAGIRYFITQMKSTPEDGLGYVRLVREVVESFVLAAEQYYGSDAGQQKKEWVLDQIQLWCKRRSIPFERSLVEHLIEAAVYMVINGPKGTKVEEVKTALAISNAGGDPRVLPFVAGDGPIAEGPPAIELEQP